MLHQPFSASLQVGLVRFQPHNPSCLEELPSGTPLVLRVSSFWGTSLMWFPRFFVFGRGRSPPPWASREPRLRITDQRTAELLASELKSHVREAAASPHANYVLQKAGPPAGRGGGAGGEKRGSRTRSQILGVGRRSPT